MGLPRLFGISALYRLLVIRDKEAFARSMRALLALDFERLVAAHWQPIETDARPAVEQALRDLSAMALLFFWNGIGMV